MTFIDPIVSGHLGSWMHDFEQVKSRKPGSDQTGKSSTCFCVCFLKVVVPDERTKKTT